jgi:hypothetical protein
MAKRKKTPEPRRRTTIGRNPLDRLEDARRRGKGPVRFKDDGAQGEIKDVLLKRRAKEGVLSKLIKSVFG